MAQGLQPAPVGAKYGTWFVPATQEIEAIYGTQLILAQTRFAGCRLDRLDLGGSSQLGFVPEHTRIRLALRLALIFFPGCLRLALNGKTRGGTRLPQ